MSQSVLLERNDATARLILNRADKKNALNHEMWRAISDRVREAEADPAVRVLIVTGAGGTFAAGADIGEFSEVYTNEESAAVYQRQVAEANALLARFDGPTIAEISGACVGGGCGLALCCDYRIADTTARLGITPAKLGLVYPWGDMKRLFDAVGLANAKDILFSGRLVKPDEGLRLGLIQKVVEPDELNDAVARQVDTLLANSGVSIRTTKKLLHKMAAGASEPDGEAAELSKQVIEGADFKEGYTAFMQKRKPIFS